VSGRTNQLASQNPPAEVLKIRAKISEFLKQTDASGRRIGQAKCGVYAFYDYDGEPIYVGQTTESLSTRIGRHLTGRRSDAVAKFVLDPFEVLEIEVWPLFAAEVLTQTERKRIVDAAEWTVFQYALANSRFRAVLNEGEIAESEPVNLPDSFRRRIVPDDLFAERSHPDIRIARRAQTIASLARLISERVVSPGLRTTLHVQAQRLEHLAQSRLDDFQGAHGGEADLEDE
jgi:hypothetical protein